MGHVVEPAHVVPAGPDPGARPHCESLLWDWTIVSKDGNLPRPAPVILSIDPGVKALTWTVSCRHVCIDYGMKDVSVTESPPGVTHEEQLIRNVAYWWRSEMTDMFIERKVTHVLIERQYPGPKKLFEPAVVANAIFALALRAYFMPGFTVHMIPSASVKARFKFGRAGNTANKTESVRRFPSLCQGTGARQHDYVDCLLNARWFYERVYQ